MSDNALIFNADIETEAVEPKERGKQTDPAAGDVVVGVGKNSEERVDSSAVALALPLLIFLASLVQFVTSFALTPINSSAAGACGMISISALIRTWNNVTCHSFSRSVV